MQLVARHSDAMTTRHSAFLFLAAGAPGAVWPRHMAMVCKVPSLLLVAAFALVGCGSSRSTPAPSADLGSSSPSPSPPLVADSANGWWFERPASWTRWQPNEHSPMTARPLVYLSTDPLLPNCAVPPGATPNPADPQGNACTWPLSQLEPNGVLVIWWTTRILEALPTDGGELIEVNATTARLHTAKPGLCGEIGADETMELLVPIGQPTPLSNIGLVACVRGPDLATAEARVKAMLATARYE